MRGIIRAVTGNRPGETGNRLIAKLLRSLVQLPKTAIAVSDDIAVFGDLVPCLIAENGDILENSVNT